MSETKRIYHPIFSDHFRDVPAKDADAWKANGWRFTPAGTPDEAPAKSEQPKKG